jgi:hypothetical protein
MQTRGPLPRVSFRQTHSETPAAHFLAVWEQINPPRPRFWHALFESGSSAVADAQEAPPRPWVWQLPAGILPQAPGRRPLGEANQKANSAAVAQRPVSFRARRANSPVGDFNGYINCPEAEAPKPCEFPNMATAW